MVDFVRKRTKKLILAGSACEGKDITNIVFSQGTVFGDA